MDLQHHDQCLHPFFLTQFVLRGMPWCSNPSDWDSQLLNHLMVDDHLNHHHTPWLIHGEWGLRCRKSLPLTVLLQVQICNKHTSQKQKLIPQPYMQNFCVQAPAIRALSGIWPCLTHKQSPISQQQVSAYIDGGAFSRSPQQKPHSRSHFNTHTYIDNVNLTLTGA